MTSVFWSVSYYTLGPLIRLAWRLRITGRENLPKKGAAVIASNHLSFLDHFVLPLAQRRQIFFISKAEHFESPVKRFFFRNWGVIPLRRGASDQEAFDRSIKVLGDGNFFGIYPEGTRSTDGKLHKGRTGVARIALTARVPIIPAAMMGTFEALPKGKSMPRFTKCEVRIGRPIDVSAWYGRENDRAALREVTDKVMHALAELSGQEYVHEYTFNPAYVSKDEPPRSPPVKTQTGGRT